MLESLLRRAVPVCCSCLLGVTASASPVISELYYDASGSDAGAVFVELFGTPGESLDGLVLEGINGSGGALYKSISLSGVIPMDGVFVIGDIENGVTLVANADQVADIDFQNGPDSVLLRDGVNILDAVGYGRFGSGDVFAGEGSAAADPAAGSSIARLTPWVDSDDNSVDFSVLENPTPGVVPQVSSVPLPASLWLMGSGLVMLFGRSRLAA